MAWVKRHYALAWGLGALVSMSLAVLGGALLPWGLKEVYGDKLSFDPGDDGLWLYSGFSCGLAAAGGLMLVFMNRLGKEESKDDAAV